MEIHELGLAKIPDNKNLSDYMNEIMTVWELILVQLQNGEIEASQIGEQVSGMLPDWNAEVRYVKSRGLVSQGHQTQNIMYLEPGNYLIECWLKDAEGRIHISNGMIRQLTVTNDENDSFIPEPDYNISLTRDGIVADEPLSSGEHLISVDFEQDENGQIIYGDVHLIQVDSNTILETVANWMNWGNINGLRAPAPAKFLGGVDIYENLSNREKSYFSVDIQPGTYAWIVNAPAEQQDWKEFTVE